MIRLVPTENGRLLPCWVIIWGGQLRPLPIEFAGLVSPIMTPEQAAACWPPVVNVADVVAALGYSRAAEADWFGIEDSSWAGELASTAVGHA